MKRYPIRFMALALLFLGGGFTISPGLADPVDQAEACLMCHDDIADLMDSPVVHPPAAESECSACHNPHVSRFSSLLNQSPGLLCATCHREVHAGWHPEYLTLDEPSTGFDYDEPCDPVAEDDWESVVDVDVLGD